MLVAKLVRLNVCDWLSCVAHLNDENWFYNAPFFSDHTNHDGKLYTSWHNHNQLKPIWIKKNPLAARINLRVECNFIWNCRQNHLLCEKKHTKYTTPFGWKKNWVISIMIINSHAQSVSMIIEDNTRGVYNAKWQANQTVWTMCEHNNDSIDLKLHVHIVHDHKCIENEMHVLPHMTFIYCIWELKIGVAIVIFLSRSTKRTIF